MSEFCIGLKPVGCESIDCPAPGYPVCCDIMGCCCCGAGWKGEGDVPGRVGTKPAKPVVVGTKGCNSGWLAGTGANGPRGPLTGEGEENMPVCWACRAWPIGTGDEPMPIPDWKPTGVEMLTEGALGGACAG